MCCFMKSKCSLVNILTIFQKHFMQVNSARKLLETKKQWVDLGVKADACLVLPETCGPEGAALVFWVKLHYCAYNDGIMSSRLAWPQRRTGLRIWYVSAHGIR